MTRLAAPRQALSQGLVLKACIFAIGLAGIVAEYVMATLASYLLGDAVLQWTLPDPRTVDLARLYGLETSAGTSTTRSR